MKAQPTTKELIEMLYERLPELFDRAAAPVQRQWVGLKDPDFSGKPNTPDFIAGAFFAEAKLKEKNNG